MEVILSPTSSASSSVTSLADTVSVSSSMERVTIEGMLPTPDRIKQGVHDLFDRLHGPSYGKISEPKDVQVSPDETSIAFSGVIWEKNSTGPPASVQSTRICLLNLESKSVTILTRGPNNDTSPRWSPDGTKLAFLSDRHEKGCYQLFVLKKQSRTSFGKAEPLAAGQASQSIQSFEWSPNGENILLVRSSTLPQPAIPKEPWEPIVHTNLDTKFKPPNSLAVYSLSDNLTTLHGQNFKFWEATWAGNNRIFGFVSGKSDEKEWYSAKPILYGLDGCSHTFIKFTKQSACPAASPNGEYCAMIQGLASDRGVVAGDIVVASTNLLRDKATIRIEKVDVTYIKWITNVAIMYAGISGLGTAVGTIEFEDAGDFSAYRVRTLLSTFDYISGPQYPAVCSIDTNTFVMVSEGYHRFPEIVLVGDDRIVTLKSFTHSGTDHVRSLTGKREIADWVASDGLRLCGWIDYPKKGVSPYPLIVYLHPGPFDTVRNEWVGRSILTFLAIEGYAIFSPNPRGSTGRGQAFAENVLGDTGGVDASDVLSGIDSLVRDRIVDPKRIGVIGCGYGGFLSTWLTSQSDRFQASVSISGPTDWRSQHFTSDVPSFDRILTQSALYNTSPLTNSRDPYLTRSPLMHADKIRTPVLQIAGAKDRKVVPDQSMMLHNALVENGNASVRVLYSHEGHELQGSFAILDAAWRIVSFFDMLMPVQSPEARAPRARTPEDTDDASSEEDGIDEDSAQTDPWEGHDPAAGDEASVEEENGKFVAGRIELGEEESD